MSGFEAALPASLVEGLLREFEALDLTGNQARVLLALLRIGPADTAHLARLSGVPRTSLYPVLEELGLRGLARQVSSNRPVTFTTPGREEVFLRLEADQEERLRQVRLRTARLAARLGKVLGPER